VFFADGRENMTLICNKCLPQRSDLSPFLYNAWRSCIYIFVPSGCGFLQYADDMRPNDLLKVLVQTACMAVLVLFDSIGLTISTSKSEVMLLSIKHERPPILIMIASMVHNLCLRTQLSNIWDFILMSIFAAVITRDMSGDVACEDLFYYDLVLVF
jgi:hypothetical protein